MTPYNPAAYQFVHFYGMKWVSARIDSRSNAVFRIVGVVLFFPSKIQGFLGSISSHVFNHTWTMQDIMANKLAHIKDKSQIRHSQEEWTFFIRPWQRLLEWATRKMIGMIQRYDRSHHCIIPI